MSLEDGGGRLQSGPRVLAQAVDELLRVIYSDPHGEVAQNVLRLCAARPSRTPAFVFWERYVNWRRKALQSAAASDA
jgi:hypothetical protein